MLTRVLERGVTGLRGWAQSTLITKNGKAVKIRDNEIIFGRVLASPRRFRFRNLGSAAPSRSAGPLV